MTDITFIENTGWICGRWGAILNKSVAVTNIEKNEPLQVSARSAFSQIYPNPFQSSTTIKFTLYESSEVNIKIIDLEGREVTTLATGFYIAGTYEISWFADGLLDGLYFCQIQTKWFSDTKVNYCY
ncbi:MAG: T9SS type A sorting domain-containing protein [Bacteroidales bacterium]|nr:T9SS type A sorting domain-containing protein [Bacteroidales bacterium]